MPKIFIQKDGSHTIIPSLLTKSFVRGKKGYSPIDVLSCYFHLNGTQAQQFSQSQQKKIMVDLAVEISLLDQSAKDSMIHYKRLLRFQNSRRLHDYFPYSQFIRSFVAFLNSIYRLKELTGEIDRILVPDCSFADYHLWNKKHIFSKYIEVRNLCVHVETPRINIEDNIVKLVFLKENILEAYKKTKFPYLEKYLKHDPGSSVLVMQFKRPLFGHAVFLASINSWALKHLKSMKKSQLLKVTIGKNKLGNPKFEDITLKYLIDHSTGMRRLKI